MKIAYIDCLPVGGGLSRYSLGLCKNLLRFDKKMQIDYYIHADNVSKMKELFDQDRLKVYLLRSTLPQNKYFSFFNKILNKVFKWNFKKSIDKEISTLVDQRYDVVYFPSAHMMSFPSLKVPIVSTMHDFNWKYFFGSKIFSDAFCDKMEQEIPKWLSNSHVITLSHATLNECKKLFPHVNSYPEVIPVGALTVYSDMTKESASQILKEKDIEFPYILYPANLFPHKNHLNLYTAFSILKRNPVYKDYKLLLTGAETDQIGFGKAEYRGILKVSSPAEDSCNYDVIGLGYTSNEFMDALIIGANLLISSSIYEEMCLPAMDAWMFGTPTVLSDIPPFREHEQILGIRSAYFDPMNPNDIANALHYCLSNIEELSLNAIVSKEKMKQYTWENVCRSYMNVFQKAIVNK